MNCTVCGQQIVLGSDRHKNCHKDGLRLKERAERLSVLLDIFAEDIDHELKLRQAKVLRKVENG